MNKGYYLPIILILVLLCLIFVYYLKLVNSKNNKIENFEGDGEEDEKNQEMIRASQTFLPEPSIYTEAYTKATDVSETLKLNLRIDPLGRDINPATKKIYDRLLVPIHLITTLDNKCLAVFNDGRIYKKNNLYEDALWIGPIPNSLYGSQEFGIGMRMIMFFPVNNNQEREVRLFAVGADNCLYYKEKDDINSEWIKAPVENNNNNDKLVYLFCDFYEKNTQYPLLYGITTTGSIVYKNLNGDVPINTIEEEDFVKLPFSEPSPIISSNVKLLKVYWDRNGFMLGIGQDFKIYQKKGIDWKVRPWDTEVSTRGKNKGSNAKVIDLMMDTDARMVGLVLDSDKKKPMIKIQKQNQPYYLADFENIINAIPTTKSFTTYDVIKHKTGLDWGAYFNFEDPDEELYRTNNLSALKQRAIMKDRLKLRKICQNRNPLINSEARNFELEKKLKEKEIKISTLTKELGGLLTYGSAKMMDVYDEPTPTPTQSTSS
jgi:hypothetical protein